MTHESVALRSQWSAWTTDGGLRFRWRRCESETVAEWEGLLTLRLDRKGAMDLEVVPGADPLVAEKLQATGVPAFVRWVDGGLSLHGSAVVHEDRGLICLGDSGAGKSTAAAELCSNAGFEIVADDVVGVELADGCWWALPSESHHWLARDGRKKPVRAARVRQSRARLALMVALRLGACGEAPNVRRVQGASFFGYLLAATQRFERSAAVVQQELDWFATMAEQVPLFELVRSPGVPPRATAAVLMDTLEALR